MSKDLPLVSAIITTKNESDVIGRLTKSIQKQSYKKIELILVDNSSSDNTVEIAKAMGVRVYKLGPERSAQRNFGVKFSKGDYFLILDADMELEEDVIKDCVDKVTADEEVGGVVIPEQSIGKNFWEKVKAFERSFYNLAGDLTTDAARFFSRKAFDKIGGYDESITGPEDWDFPENVRKAGFKIERINSKIFHYERISSVFSLVRKKYYYALKSSRYLKKNNISAFSPKTIYFLRPVFYKNWHMMLTHPILSLGLFVMLSLEQLAGVAGYLKGRNKDI